MEVNPSIRFTIFWPAYDLYPGKGTSRVMLTATYSENPDQPPKPSMTGLITTLASLDVMRARPAVIDRTLAQAVDTSRPWQEPDREDLLAALPEIKAALAPIAQHVPNWT
jgi:hypothetical protein